jgi:hypothetical protein
VEIATKPKVFSVPKNKDNCIVIPKNQKRSAMHLFHTHKSSCSELLPKKMNNKEAYSDGMISVLPGKFHTPPHAVDKKTTALLGQGGSEGKGKHGFDCWHEKSYSRVLQKKNSFLGHLDDIATDRPHTTRSIGFTSSSVAGTHGSITSTNSGSCHIDGSGSCHNDLPDHHPHHGLRGVFRKVKSLVHRRPHHEDQDWK